MVKVPIKGQEPLEIDVGDTCVVTGYDGCTGIVRFVGKGVHEKAKGKWRIGVELDKAMGKNNGTVGGHEYFGCPEDHGVFVAPGKVAVLSVAEVAKENPLFSDSEDAPAAATAETEGTGAEESSDAAEGATVTQLEGPEDDATALLDGINQERAATAIQAGFRGHLARRQARAIREERAAIKIQAGFRGSVARKEAAELREEAAAAAAKLAEEKRHEWQPKKGAAKRSAEQFKKLAEQQEQALAGLAEKQSKTQEKAKSHMLAQLHKGVDHYKPPASADPLWKLMNKARAATGLSAMDTPTGTVIGTKWSTAHERERGAHARGFSHAAAQSRKDLDSINWRTGGFRSVDTAGAPAPTTMHLDSVAGAVTLQFGWTAASEMTGLFLSSALGVPCSRARLVQLDQAEGTDLQKKMTSLRHDVMHVFGHFEAVQLKTFLPFPSLSDHNTQSMAALCGSAGSLSTDGAAICRDLGRMIAVDLLLGFDGRFGLLPGGASNPDITKIDPASKRAIAVRSVLVPPEGTPARGEFDALQVKTVSPPPPDEEGFGFGDEPEAAAPEPAVAPPPEDPPEERKAKKQSKRIASAFSAFGASVKPRKKSGDAESAAAAAKGGHEAVAPPSKPAPVPYAVAWAQLVDDLLGQYTAQGALLGEKPQSKSELPQFLAVRTLIQQWTGHDLGAAGSLAMQNGVIEFLIECTRRADADDADAEDAVDPESDSAVMAELDAELSAWVAEVSRRPLPDASLVHEAAAGFRAALATCKHKLRIWRSRGGV